MNPEHSGMERHAPKRRHDHVTVILFLLFVWGLALLCVGIGLACLDGRP